MFDIRLQLIKHSSLHLLHVSINCSGHFWVIFHWKEICLITVTSNKQLIHEISLPYLLHSGAIVKQTFTVDSKISMLEGYLEAKF